MLERTTLPLDTVLLGDSLTVLRGFPENSIHCCVTSPPYYALRDYEAEGQIGQEATPEEYIERLVAVFHEVKRVLRPDGTFWLNIADTYCKRPQQGVKRKDMLGIPWRLALALRSDGWYLRSNIIWEKGNAMPESVTDRCSRSYEHIFQMSKSKRYYFDLAAIAEPIAPSTLVRMRSGRSGSNKYAERVPGQTLQAINRPRETGASEEELPTHRNKRDVWHINTTAYSGAHFATFPPQLAETCILAGCPEGGVVLDPFFGSGTTGLAAKRNGRHYIGVEINPAFCQLAEERIAAGAHQGRSAARQADSAILSDLPGKAAQNAPKPPKKAEKEEA